MFYFLYGLFVWLQHDKCSVIFHTMQTYIVILSIFLTDLLYKKGGLCSGTILFLTTN